MPNLRNGSKGAIQVLSNTIGGGGGCQLSRKKRYEGLRFNVISVTRGWVGVKITGKKRYVTLECPQRGIRTRALSIASPAFYR